MRIERVRVCLALVATVRLVLAVGAQEPKRLEEPKPVKLDGLRQAVADADRRGENVIEVRRALDAFEKALPSAKPGVVPTELQALRDAVDAADRKGERVAEVSKELKVVEFAIAGRTLSRPTPKPKPAPGQPGGEPVTLTKPNGFDAYTGKVAGGKFTITATKDKIVFNLTGIVDRTRVPTLSRAVVEPPGMMHTSDLVFKLPAEYQKDVETLLKSVAPKE